jgi:hypothetical protein
VAWTGSELIVYGGHTRDSFGFFTDGAVYSPAARDWRPMSSPPDGTGSTSGVWTGSELLVVARAGTSLYHPGTDRWRQLPAGIDPGGIVWIDTAYVWNGDGVHRLDGEAWTPLDELPAGFAYTDRAQSQLLAVGGDLVALSATPSECGGHRIARYDGRQWRELPAATVDTSGPTPSCSYADGLASVGGHLVAWSGDRLPAIVLDPAAGRWLELAGGSPLLIGRSEPITGGLAVGEQLLVPSAPLGAVIDPGRDQLLAVELPGPGNPNEMVWTGNEVLMWGASQEHGSLAVPDAWRWTPPPAAG